MATTDNLQVLPSPNREFGLQVLRHVRADGTPVYTIGIWEEGDLRCICHAQPITTALVVLGREFGGRHNGANAPDYPRRSEITELVSRLGHHGRDLENGRRLAGTSFDPHPVPPQATNHAAITTHMISADPGRACDTPSCAHCGSLTKRNGSCYMCGNCGSTTGCS